MPNNRVAFRRCVHVVALACLVACVAAITGAYPTRVAQTPPAHAQAQVPAPPLRLDIVDQLGGATYAVASAAPYVYAGVGPRLYVLAVDARGGLTAVGRTAILPGVVRDIALDGTRAYAALMDGSTYDARGALAVIDIAVPARPVVAAVLTADAAYQAVAVVGSHVLLGGGGDVDKASGNQRGILDTVAVTDPAGPRRAARLTFDRPILDVAASGAHAFAISLKTGTTVNVIDIAQPGAPLRLAARTFPGAAARAEADGDRLYLASNSAGVRVIDISAPADPHPLARVDAGWCADALALAGDRLAVVGGCDGQVRTFVTGRTGVPVQRADVIMPGPLTAAAWLGDQLIVARRDGGFAAISAASGTTRVVGELALPGAILQLGRTTSATGGAADGSNAAIVARGPDALTSFTLADAPSQDGGFVRLAGHMVLTRTVEAAVVGAWAYVIAGPSGSVHAVDWTDAARPRQAAVLAFPDPATAIAGDPRGVIFVGFGGEMRLARVAAYDVARPDAPQPAGIVTAVGVQHLAIDGDRLVAERHHEIAVIDITDPRQPQVVSRPPNPGFPGSIGRSSAIAVRGARFYKTQVFWPGGGYNTGSLDVHDTADPNAQAIIRYGSGDLAAPEALVFDGPRLLMGGDQALFVLEAASLDTQFNLLGRTSTPGTVHDVLALPVDGADPDARTLLVADGDGGLLVVRQVAAAAPTLVPTAAPSWIPAPMPAATPTAAQRPNPIYLPYTARHHLSPRGVPALRLVDAIRGPTRGVAWNGNTLYAAHGGRIEVIDATTLASPRLVTASSLLSDLVHGLTVDGDTLYAATGEPGVAIFDVRTPLDPALVSRIPASGLVSDVAVANGVAYVAAGDAGLRLFDVADPRRPRPLGAVELAHGAWGVRVHRGFAYVVSEFESVAVQVVDVRDPAAPKRVAELAGEDDGGGMAVALAGEYAYALTCNVCLEVFDISDPANPRREPFETFEADGLALAVDGDRLYVAFQSVQVFDLTDPAQPVLRGSSEIGLPRTNALAVDRGRVALAGGTGPGNVSDFGYDEGGGLRLIDATDPDAPRNEARLLGGIDPEASLFPTGRDDRVYVEWRSSSDVPDHAFPDSPSAIPAPMRILEIAPHGRMRLSDPVPELERVEQFAVVGQLGIALHADHNGTLAVWDIRDPAAPRRLGEGISDVGTYGLAAAGTKAYVIEPRWMETPQRTLLRVIDFADPARPVEVGQLWLDQLAYGMAVAGEQLYIPAQDELLHIDARDPAAPRVAQRHPAPQTLPGNPIVVAAGRVWWSTGRGLTRLDLLGNAPPVSVATTDYIAAVTALTDGRLVVVGANLSLIDVSSGVPRTMRTWEPPAWMRVGGQNALIAAGRFVVFNMVDGNGWGGDGPMLFEVGP